MLISEEVKMKKLLDIPHYSKLASVFNLLQNSWEKQLIIAYTHWVSPPHGIISLNQTKFLVVQWTD